MRTIVVRNSLLLAFALAALAGCQVQEPPTALAPAGDLWQAATCEVTTAADDGTLGTLRSFITDSGCATITFAVAGPITLDPDRGQLVINRNVSIQGPEAGITVRRDPAASVEFRVFQINPGVAVQMSHLTITGGNVGGIESDMDPQSCELEGPAPCGGGIRNEGTLTLSYSTVSGNMAESGGGGIFNDRGGTLTLSHSTVLGNTAERGPGGGIYSGDSTTTTILNSTMSGNRASNGGGIYSGGSTTTTILNSTMSGNTSSSWGGGVYNNGGLTTIVSSTLTGNRASRGGGVHSFNNIFTRTDVKNSLIWGNTLLNGTTPNDVAAASTSTRYNSLGHNLVGAAGDNVDFTLDFIQTGDQTAVPVGTWLGALQDNDGPTHTHALLEDSPAIDKGVCTDHTDATVATDQRGVSRPQGTACDIGAFELFVASTATETTTTLILTPATQQYSDRARLQASLSPEEATGSVQFQRSTDGGASFADLGGPVAVTDGAAELDYTVSDAAEADVRFQAVFTATGNYLDSTSDAQVLSVVREDATVRASSGNPAALRVSSAGGSLAAGALTLAFEVQETSPDVAVTTAAAGDIEMAGLAVTLVPVSGGSSHVLDCTAGSVAGAGYDAVRPFTCTNAGALPVDAYEVVATVTGGYYGGDLTDAFTVYDPSLGFATGGGTFVLDGERVNFGFAMRYNRNGTNLRGSFVAVRHHVDGTTSRLKSNALGSLALGEDPSGPFGWASFDGRATYTVWDAGVQDYVTVGNQRFEVYAEDRDRAGGGTDRIWLGGPGALDMLGTRATARNNTVALSGGNVSVPQGGRRN